MTAFYALHRRVDHELQRGIVVGLKTRVLEMQHAQSWMRHRLEARGGAADLVGFPPFDEFRAALPQKPALCAKISFELRRDFSHLSICVGREQVPV